MRTWLIGLVTLFTVFAIILFYSPVAFIWYGFESYLSRPNDGDLVQQFDKERSKFERIIVMMNENPSMSQQYGEVFSQAGLLGGTRRRGSSDIKLDVWSWGIVPAGIDISFLYCGKPFGSYRHAEEPCLEGKDTGDKHDQHGEGYRYKKIAPDWYIYEESN